MAMTFDEFMQRSGAELCGGRLIVGTGKDRRYVGENLEGQFNLNENGNELLAALEAGKSQDDALAHSAGKARAKKDKPKADDDLILE